MTPQQINEAVAQKLGFGQWIDQSIVNGGNLDWSPKDYCTSIAAAWEIVEHLTPTHIFTLLAVGVTAKRCYKVTFENDTYRGEPDEVFAEANTAPMAICLAFLKIEGGK